MLSRPYPFLYQLIFKFHWLNIVKCDCVGTHDLQRWFMLTVAYDSPPQLFNWSVWVYFLTFSTIIIMEYMDWNYSLVTLVVISSSTIMTFFCNSTLAARLENDWLRSWLWWSNSVKPRRETTSTLCIHGKFSVHDQLFNNTYRSSFERACATSLL